MPERDAQHFLLQLVLQLEHWKQQCLVGLGELAEGRQVDGRPRVDFVQLLINPVW